MTDVRLSHPTRGTLEFRQQQRHVDTRDAKASVTAELATDRDPLVHTQTREQTTTIRGVVTGIGRAAADPTTSDAVQALANYVDRLESHVDEFQGNRTEHYTFEDDILGTSKSCVLEGVTWERQTGQPYDIEFEVTLQIGRPTMTVEDITRRNPTVDTSMDTMLRVDGEDLPGLRQYKVSRSIGIEPKAIWDRSTAENNDAVMQEGVTQEVTYEGTITGSKSARRSKDQALDSKLATSKPVTLETQFPGYDLDGYVLGYDSTQERRHGENIHHYSLRFVEGQKA